MLLLFYSTGIDSGASRDYGVMDTRKCHVGGKAAAEWTGFLGKAAVEWTGFLGKAAVE